jgi:adenine-specific DNA methylase
MNDAEQMAMSTNKPYGEGKRKSGLKTVKFVQKCIIAWHKHHYLKYRYLEEGCMNKKIRKELEGKKLYHYKKYIEISLNNSYIGE